MSASPDMEVILPGTFDPQLCYEGPGERAGLHPTALQFLSMSNEEIVELYAASRPQIDKNKLLTTLNSKTEYFCWGGSDLFPYEDASGNKGMTLIEINTCPVGNSFCAQLNYGRVGHAKVIREAMLSRLPGGPGVLAVFYNLPKNRRDLYGYASALADATGEKVFLVNLGPSLDSRPDCIRWADGWRPEILVGPDDWQPIRAVFIRLGLQPWKQVPIINDTVMINPIVSLIAGGHNKLSAAKAFEQFNRDYSEFHIEIDTPKTYAGVPKQEIPAIAALHDYLVVIKIAYSAAGIGIHLVTNKSELDEFMAADYPYERYVVQSMIAGHPDWYPASVTGDQRRFHRLGRLAKLGFVFDLRFILANGDGGWRPAYIMGRWARESATPKRPGKSSPVMKTNLSRVQKDQRQQRLDHSQSIILSEENFDQLGLSLEDLAAGYVQSALAAVAIDNVCKRLAPRPDMFDLRLLHDINGDLGLLEEIAEATPLVRKAIENGTFSVISSRNT